MLQLLVTPKWLAFTALLVVTVATFTVLGAWQWERARSQSAPPVAQEPASVVPLASVYEPGEPVPANAVGQRVRVGGSYDRDLQLLVPRRTGTGDPSYWVLTPLRTATGALLPVVRGWTLESDGDLLDPPAGRAAVTGVLSESEPDSLRLQAPEDLPDGQVAIVSTAELLSLWGDDLYQGFVVLAEQRPAGELTPVDPPAPSAGRGLSWQSLAYAIQWWLFAAFALFFWWRILQADREDRRQSSNLPPTDLMEAQT